MVDLIKLAKTLIGDGGRSSEPAGVQEARTVSLRHACAKEDTVFDMLYAETGGRYVRQESRAGAGAGSQMRTTSAEVSIDRLDLPACPGCGNRRWIFAAAARQSFAALDQHQIKTTFTAGPAAATMGQRLPRSHLRDNSRRNRLFRVRPRKHCRSSIKRGS